MPVIDGLSSGLDTTSIIRQLMQLERAPQQRLQDKQGATEAAITSLRNLNARFLTVGTAAEGFGAVGPGTAATTPKPTDWQLTTATSSDATRVSASAVTGTPTSGLTFNVEQLAKAASYLGATVYTGTAEPFSQTGGVTNQSLTLTRGSGAPVTVNTGSGSLADTVAAINAANAGVSASTIQIKPGEYQIQLTSTTTGEGSIALQTPAGVTVATSQVVAGQNAVLVLGDGTKVSRASNTMSDVLQGVTLTLAKADTQTVPGVFDQPPVSITAAQDTEGIAAKVQALVDAANAARQEAKTLTNFNLDTKVKGRLYGDSSVRSLVDQVRGAVGAGDSQLLLAGVTVDRDGTVNFDKAVFLERLAADPGAVETALGKDGLAGRLHRLAYDTTRGEAALGGPGLLANAIKSRESQISSMKTNIESWDSRLALKERQLQRQYTALETALGKAKSQGAWLSGQLANLPSWGN